MADKTNVNSPASNPAQAQQANPGASQEEILEANLPEQEKDQPDVVLQLSHGRLGAGWVAFVAILAAFALGVVLYALNSPTP